MTENARIKNFNTQKSSLSSNFICTDTTHLVPEVTKFLKNWFKKFENTRQKKLKKNILFLLYIITTNNERNI